MNLNSSRIFTERAALTEPTLEFLCFFFFFFALIQRNVQHPHFVVIYRLR